MRLFSISTSTFRLKKCSLTRCFIQNCEEIEYLKNEKSPGIVLEFCFPVSVRTLLQKTLILNAGVLVLKPSSVLGTAIENCYWLENYDVQIQHVVFINNYAFMLGKNRQYLYY